MIAALALAGVLTVRGNVCALEKPPLRSLQDEIYFHPKRELVLLGSTQGVGKTYALSAWALARAWSRPQLGGWWAVPTLKQAEPGYQQIVTWASTAKVMARATTAPMRIRLKNGGRIDFVSWERDENLLGPTIGWLVVDQGEKLTSRARGILSSRRGNRQGPARYAGNASVVGSEFHKLCAQAQDAGNAERMAYRKWIWKDYAAILPPDERAEYEAFIAGEERTLLPSEFKRLYLAEWATPEEALFDEDTIQKLFCLDASDIPHSGHRYIIGWDIGLTTDYTVGAPLCLECGTVTSIVRTRGGDSSRMKQVIAETCAKWNNATGVIELNNQGQAIFDETCRLYKRLQGWWTDNESKREAVARTIAKARDGRLKLAAIPEMMNEFRTYRSLRSPTSLVWSFAAPEGMHDDIVTAVLIAVGASTSGGQAYIEMLARQVENMKAKERALREGRAA